MTSNIDFEKLFKRKDRKDISQENYYFLKFKPQYEKFLFLSGVNVSSFRRLLGKFHLSALDTAYIQLQNKLEKYYSVFHMKVVSHETFRY